MSDSGKAIDLREILFDRDPDLRKKLKKYHISILEWLLKTEKLNALISKYSTYSGTAFAQQILDYFGIRVEIKELHHLRNDERYIFASNHPSAGIDGLSLITAVSKFMQNFRVIVDDVLCHFENLKPVFVPISAVHKQKGQYVGMIDELYKSDKQVVIFPAGNCSRKINGKIQDFEWQPHFIKKAIASKRSVVPVHISGRNPDFYYQVHRLRTFLHLKINLEEMFLARIFLAQKPETITITFKKPVHYDNLKDQPYRKKAQEIRNMVYGVKEQGARSKEQGFL